MITTTRAGRTARDTTAGRPLPGDGAARLIAAARAQRAAVLGRMLRRCTAALAELAGRSGAVRRPPLYRGPAY